MSGAPAVHTVEVLIDGRPFCLLDVPTAQGADAACRRARFVVAAMPEHRASLDLGRIECRVYVEPGS